MILKTYDIGASMRLDYVGTEKFKKSRLSLSVVRPFMLKYAAEMPLVFPVSLRGTEKYPDFASLCRRCDELYAATISDVGFADGDNIVRGLRVSVLNDSCVGGEKLLDGTLELMSQALLYPRLDDAAVENEKINMINRLRSVINEPFNYAVHRLAELMFEDEPRGLRNEELIDLAERITPESLRESREVLLSGARLEFFYCGSASAQTVIEIIEKYFGGFSSRPEPLPPTLTKKTVDKVKTVDESGPYRQSTLLLGFRSGALLGDPEFYATELFNTVFGDGPVSRLFANVREKLSLCYSCGSDYNECKGTLLVDCGIDAADRQRAQDEIFAQLEAMRRGEITDADLEAAKKSLLSDCIEAEDNPADYESFYRIERYFGGPRTIEEYRDGVLAVTRDEVAAAARAVTLDTVYFLEGTAEGEYDD